MAPVPCIAFFLLLGLQEAPELLEPSPPANRFDPDHHARLVEAWGSSWSPLDTRQPDPQREPIRGTRWVVIEEAGERSGSRTVVDGETGIAPFRRATATITVEEDEVRFVRAPGVETIFVAGEGFVGDPERRGWLGVPVLLRAGENELELVGFDGGSFELELWDPVPDFVLGVWAAVYFEPSFGELSLPVFDARARPSEDLHFHYGRAAPPGELPGLSEWHDGGFMSPLGMVGRRSLPFDFSPREPDSQDVMAPLTAFGSEGVADCRVVDLRTFEPSEGLGTSSAPIVLVYETSGPEELARAALAAARYCQQLVWYRTGAILECVSDTWLASERGEWLRANRRFQARFGAYDGAPGTAVLRSAGSDDLEVRAADAAAMRLVYDVDLVEWLEAPGESRELEVR